MCSPRTSGSGGEHLASCQHHQPAGIPSSDMAGTVVLLFVSLLAAVSVDKSEAVRCFVCSSDVDPSCGDPFNATSKRFLVIECEKDRSLTPYLRANAVCRKFSHKVDERSVVVRSCAWGTEHDMDGPCSGSTLNYAKNLESCSTCNTDECNSANGLTSMYVLITLSVALLTARNM